MRAVLISIVVLAIAFVVGDRVAVSMAQDEIGRRIAAGYNLAQDPAVDIRGFPFLTQAIDGTYRDVTITVGAWTDRTISVRDLEVDLTDVSAPLSDVLGGNASNLVAGTATATALVPYDVVRGYAPEGTESLANGPDGLRVTGTFSVQGIPVPVPATVVVTVAPVPDGIQVTPVSVQSIAGGPTISLALLSDSLTFTVPLQELPLGARLTAITPADSGLSVTAVAENVRFSDLPNSR
ncbi:DUF2993 domain-containing protein [Nocardia sp. 2]|uniref:DUF2993 domain-containing protein n=1 Tax=Nocardia acididurans TaxID=2802282 RepID=A0ABS1M169_9NOCA|nr:DUF2993 domain-containing protein [Nocardia acididurans]MBL1074091.1 DUF2993 domain-containing protein [Nocardia acididurans]